MEQASFLVKDNQVHINIPISKSDIDRAKRIVRGWATIDNIDQSGDVVTAEASMRAFQSFRGNIREMHDKYKAVGKLVDFEQREVFGKDGKAYTGIFVHVYVSKGAEDTWQKILDGTLSGFSVYGPIAEQGISKQYIPDSDKMVRFITDYSLIELSLVDNPGNELCNVLEIQKSADPTGIVTDVQIENVFWCSKDEMAFVSKSENHKCDFCRTNLVSVGWIERADAEMEDFAKEVRKILESVGILSEVNPEHACINYQARKGGQEMSEKEQETAEALEENSGAEVSEVTEAIVEEVEKVNEPSLAGINDALIKIQETLEQATAGGQERDNALSKVREAVEGVEAKVEKQLADLLDRHEKLATEFTTFKEGLGTVEKRLETIEGATALRKSNDVEDEDINLSKGNTKKSVWVGSFLPTSFDQ
jgi:flagellar motility protein MotE (MotC chaperone)